MSKKRALQVVLSSVPMNNHTKSALIVALQNTHESDEEIETVDAAGRVQIMLAVDCLNDCDMSFPKKALIGRMISAKNHLRRLL